jgi:uncharacterized membrane protein YcaP (DUF421 family)
MIEVELRQMWWVYVILVIMIFALLRILLRYSELTNNRIRWMLKRKVEKNDRQ